MPLTLAGLALVRARAPGRGPLVWLFGVSLVFFAAWLVALTHELAHYKDLIHFDLSVNDRVLSIVANGQARLDGLNVDAANALLRTQVAEYELPAGFVSR